MNCEAVAFACVFNIDTGIHNLDQLHLETKKAQILFEGNKLKSHSDRAAEKYQVPQNRERVRKLVRPNVCILELICHKAPLTVQRSNQVYGCLRDNMIGVPACKASLRDEAIPN